MARFVVRLPDQQAGDDRGLMDIQTAATRDEDLHRDLLGESGHGAVGQQAKLLSVLLREESDKRWYREQRRSISYAGSRPP